MEILSNNKISINLPKMRPGTVRRLEGAINPIAAEVVGHRLWSINEEGSTTIIHASGSPVVHGTDYNFGIYMPNGDMAISGTYYMIPLYTITVMIQLINERFAGNIHEGDVFITNDPFTASVHQNDVQFVAPFFHEGKLVAWTGCMAHMLDLGGKYPGSWVPDARSCYEEGIRVPLTKLVDRGELNRPLWDTILFASRLPTFVANDFSAFLASFRVTHERLKDLCEKYSADLVHDTMAQSIDDTEAEMRAILRTLPDGTFTYHGYYDHNGFENEVYHVPVTLHKKGEELLFDLQGAARQVVGMGNASKWGTMGAIATAVLGSFGQKLHWNAGIMAPIHLELTPESIISAELPSPVSAGSVAANWVAATGSASCLGKLLAFDEENAKIVCGPPDGSWLLAQFGGTKRDGDPFAIMYMDSLGWGGPAFPHRDGTDSGGSLVVGSGGFNDVELHEKTTPLIYLWRREIAGSGGAGRFRGGNGIEYALAVHGADTVSATLASNGMGIPSLTGMFGAHPGSTPRYEITRKSDWLDRLQNGEALRSLDTIGGGFSVLPIKSALELSVGDAVNCVVQNAGGYGDPLLRDPALVAADVRDRKVNAEIADRIYGVPLLEDGSVDLQAVEKRRRELRDERLSSATLGRSVDMARRPLNGADPVARWANALIIASSPDGLEIACHECGNIMGALEDDWRSATATRTPSDDELGPGRVLDERFHYEQNICPHCATSLWVEPRKNDQARTDDFRLTGFLSVAAE